VFDIICFLSQNILKCESFSVAINSVEIVIAIAVAALAITLSAFSCRALCCHPASQNKWNNQPG
jgi:hypothetical protein